MSKKIRIILKGQAPPHIVARARGKVSSMMNHAQGDDGVLGGTKASLGPDYSDEPWLGHDDTSNKSANTVDASIIQSNPKRVSKSEFYKFRDSVYQMIIASGKNHEAIQGDPFSKFSHATIKDSPFKNYAGLLAGFKELVKQYFPEIYAQIQNKSYQAQKETKNSLPLDVDVEETLKDVSSEYIQTLYAKKEAGLTLTKAEQNILRAYEKIQDELRGAAKRTIQSDIEKFLTDNWIFILIALIVLITLIKKK
jgi:hypothetical protein